MTDPYQVLGVDPRARQEEVEAAFEEALAARRASRKGASDLHAAFAVVGDPSLRKAHDLVQMGRLTNERLSAAKDAAVDALPEIDWAEVRREATQTALKVTVMLSGAAARAADATARVSRRVQIKAAKRINCVTPVLEPAEEAGQEPDCASVDNPIAAK